MIQSKIDFTLNHNRWSTRFSVRTLKRVLQRCVSFALDLLDYYSSGTPYPRRLLRANRTPRSWLRENARALRR